MDESLDIETRPHSTPNPRRFMRTDESPKRSGGSRRSTHRSYSLDSTGDSTRSLLSVLSHSSVGSLSTGSITDDENESDRPANLTRNIKTPESSISSSDHGNTLSPWEQWLVSKEKEDRLKVKKAMKIEEEKQRQEEEKKKEKEELLKKASGKYKEWSEQKTIQQKVRTKNELRKKRIEEEMQKEEKRKIEEKATEKFQEWTEKKKEAEKERKRKEKEKQAKKEEEEKERRLKAEEKYNEWKDQAKNRPKPQRSSFGYTMGTLTGYYDAGAYPIPSYYNPVPWQPTEVPKSKSSRVKTSRKPRSAKSKKNSVVSEPQSQVKYKTKALQDNLTIWGKHK